MLSILYTSINEPLYIVVSYPEQGIAVNIPASVFFVSFVVVVVVFSWGKDCQGQKQ